MTTMLTTKQFADKLGTDGRTARKFLRSITPKDAQPGKGSRWSIAATNFRSLKKAFADYEKAVALRAAEAAKDIADELDADTLDALGVEDGDKVIEVDDDSEPTDSELDEIDA